MSRRILSRRRRLCGACCDRRRQPPGRPLSFPLPSATAHLRGASGTPPPTAANRVASHCRQPPRRPGGRPPYIPLYYIPQPQPPVISRCRLATHTKQKAGANISFAPAVLLLRSHSLITLFVIFRTVSASSWESSYLYANFVCPFKTLTNCSLDLPSGSLFAQKHLWNGVMFVIKIVLGVMGLMPRTKAS